MILLDEETALLPKAQQATVTESSSSTLNDELVGQELPPPPYYQSTQIRPPDAAHFHDDDNCTHVRANRRFLRGLIVAFVIWSLFSTFVKGIFYVAQHHWARDAITILGYSPADGRIRSCTVLNTLKSGNSSLDFLDAPTFSLPLFAQSITLFSRGTFAPSVLELVPSSNTTTLTADVRILTRTSSPALADTYLCSLSSHDASHHALGIYGPSDHELDTSSGALSVFITLRVPSLPTSSVRIANLTTHLPAFQHALGDIGGSVHFTHLSLSTDSGSIDVKSLTADNVTLSTHSGSISAGALAVHASLAAHTAHGDIAGAFALHARGAAGEPPHRLSLDAPRGNVSAVLGLHAASTLAPGTFDVALHAGNPSSSPGIPNKSSDSDSGGTAVLVLHTSPARAHAHVNVSAPREALVVLPPLYSGAFVLHAGGAPPRLAARTGGVLADAACREDAARGEVLCVDTLADDSGHGIGLVGGEWHPHGAYAGGLEGVRRTRMVRARETGSGYLSEGMLEWEGLGEDGTDGESVVWVSAGDVKLVM